MAVDNLSCANLAGMNRDSWLLFLTRACRMFAYGATGVILALYMSAVGLPDQKIGVLMTGTLLGDAAISLAVTMLADQFGRRRMLLLGCGLKMLGAAVFAYVSGPNFWLLLFGATIGVISPSGNEVGPFLSLEQSMLSDHVAPSQRTTVFAWYNLLGFCSTASGALLSGFLTVFLVDKYDIKLLDSYRLMFAGYGGVATLIALLVLCLSMNVETADWQAHHKAKRASRKQPDTEAAEPLLTDQAETDDAVEAAQSATGTETAPAADAVVQKKVQKSRFGLSKESRKIVARLSFLFTLDSFAGGLVPGSLLAYYFHERFGVDNAYLGGLLFTANVIAGISSLAAGWVGNKFGLVNTMVFTHLPGSVMLACIPLMPTLFSATALLFVRYCVCTMDVAPRQSYVSGIVPAHERTATMGITNIVKSLGAALGPTVTGYLAANMRFDWAFYMAGGLKVLYDLLLLWSFSKIRAEHETVPAQR